MIKSVLTAWWIVCEKSEISGEHLLFVGESTFIWLFSNGPQRVIPGVVR
jgi:hypothetical protein